MESLEYAQEWQLQEILTLMRIDKILERNQIRRDMKKRFVAIARMFRAEDYDNPVTKASILDSLGSIKKELDKSFSRS
jgi:hypothetical protein